MVRKLSGLAYEEKRTSETAGTISSTGPRRTDRPQNAAICRPSQGILGLSVRSRGWAWRAAFPYTGIAISPVTPDGRGGVWLVLQAGADNKQWFCHYSAGRWTRTPVPSRSGEQPGVSDLVWVPGTHSQWAVGDVSSADDDGTAILKYGT